MVVLERTAVLDVAEPIDEPTVHNVEDVKKIIRKRQPFEWMKWDQRRFV